MASKETMKAIIYTKYGSPEVLHIEEVEKPTPSLNEVLIKIYATTVTKYDCWTRSCTAPFGFRFLTRLSSGIRKPKEPIIGMELAGEIEAVGKEVKNFKKGDHVFGFSMDMRTYAEYICLPEDSALAIKSNSISYEEAAVVPYGALTALYFLRKGNIQKGQDVLIFGASGGVGHFAVQIAKHFGAKVTGVCSTKKIDLVKSLGAEKVIDYKKNDFTKSNEKYDVIFDTIGKSPFSGSRKSLKKNGCYIFSTFSLPRILRVPWFQLTSNKKAIIGLLEPKSEDLIYIRDLIEDGKLKSIIDKRYPFEQIVDAHEYVETGQKMGNVVITINHNTKK